MNAPAGVGCARRWGASVGVVAALAFGVSGAMSGRALADDPIATVNYACKDGKTIKATFYDDKADLVLGDGRKISLPQAKSADGGRYANDDESFVFWAVGSKAFVTEGDPNTQTFADCVGKPET